jgi:sigma-54 dependent transcriptional regulator, acetoin dehydrogenase operon transcriptional activator AcoR
VIGWEHLCDDMARSLRAMASGADEAPAPNDLRALSRIAIDRALAQSGGNFSEAARQLGISRNTLYRKLRG